MKTSAEDQILINWRDMFSMISSPDPLFLIFPPHSVPNLQQEGVSFFFSPEAEELTVRTRPEIKMAAITITIKVLRFMVVVFAIRRIYCRICYRKPIHYFPGAKSAFHEQPVLFSGMQKIRDELQVVLRLPAPGPCAPCWALLYICRKQIK